MCQQPLPARVIRSTGKTDLLPGGQGHRAELGWRTKPGSPGDFQCQLGACKSCSHDRHARSRDSTGLDLVQQAQESHEIKGDNCCRAQLEFTVLWQDSRGGRRESSAPLGVPQKGRWAAGSADSVAGWAQCPTRAAINQWSHSSEKLTPARTHRSHAEGRGQPRRGSPCAWGPAAGKAHQKRHCWC